MRLSGWSACTTLDWSRRVYRAWLCCQQIWERQAVPQGLVGGCSAEFEANALFLGFVEEVDVGLGDCGVGEGLPPGL